MNHDFLKEKIITIFGPRQVGKTTLAKKILKIHRSEKNYFNCDIPSIAQRFENLESLLLERIIDISKLIVIDEAQRIRNEMASKLNTSMETIERYIDLLEKAFVIFRLKPLSRNRRNEIARNK